ncbi:MAG: hypothetical protein J6G98_01145 [Bacilli bacterium]|nr:hypothetical protein [Bacilli bacterium]
MDNKDFDEIEDIFDDDIEENYDVPVFEPQASDVDMADSVNDEVPSVDTVNQVDEVPVYENIASPETLESKMVNEEVETPIFEGTISSDSNTMNEDTINGDSSLEENIEVTPVQPEPVYEDTTVDNEVSYGPVALEPAYSTEVNEHPTAVVSLNNNYEEENENVKLEDIPNIKLSDNKSLKFVLIIGIIIFVAIMLLPLLNKFSI